MPSHSRTRDRNYNRDRTERDYYSRHRRYNKDDRNRGDEVEIDDDEEDDQREEYRRRRNEFAARRGQSRDYETIEVEEEESDDGEEEVVDNSRSRHRSVPRQAPEYDDPPRTPRRARPEREERYRDEYSSRRRTRDKTPKAKESPATSPKKRLDREGYRRNTSHAREGSPVRERRQRHRDDDGIRVVGDRDRTRDEDQDRELRRQQRRKERRDRELAAQKHTSTDSTNSASQLLSADALAKLNDYYERERTKTNNQRDDDNNDRRERRRQRTREIPAVEDENDRIRVEKRRDRRRPPSQQPARKASYRKEKKTFYDDDNDAELVSRHNRGRRLVSGAVMEEGRSNKLFFWKRFGRRNDPAAEKDMADYPEDDGDDGHGGRGGGAFYSRDLKDPDAGDYDHVPFWRRTRNLIIAGVVVLLLAIIIAVAIVESRKKSSGTSSSGGSGGSGSSSSYGPYNSSLSTISEDSIPASAKGTILDPFTWYDTRDFNLTYTNETVGGLPLMGLNSTWDDSAQPNSNVPALNKNFTYGTTPIRGVNIGGWLSIEPFITPSFFSKYSTIDGVIDEYTLTQKLGSAAAATIEEHYATFIQEEDFAEIAAAGLDHVRIPYSYWAVTTYDGDPYVKQISWRYLLRAIEYCRKYGLRVNLDLHGLPGSQNGYNHSGRQGLIRWLNGTDGTLNAQRSLDIHNQLSQFFAQPRYQNIITIYGLANEPPLLSLDISTVLNWTVNATEIVQKNGIKAKISMGDGFLNLDKWEYIMKTNVPSNLLLDTHQYTIFNINEIDLNHTAKINLICNSWLPMIEKVNSTTNGFGQTICGEFSQADTDCTQYLNNVNTGTRWEGTLSGSTTPDCYTKSSDCSCASANADVSSYSSDYKLWLQTYAEAQFSAFETAMGWFYWTWQTESAPQWSYKQARAGGFLPQLAYKPNFTCGDTVPSFGSLPEYY